MTKTIKPLQRSIKAAGDPRSLAALVDMVDAEIAVASRPISWNGTPANEEPAIIPGAGSAAYIENGDPVVTPTLNSNPLASPPTGADVTRTLLEDGVHVFTLADFSFADADGDAFYGVIFTSFPGAGTIFFDPAGPGGNAREDIANHGTGVQVFAADIAAGKLFFVPAADGNGADYANFQFRVRSDNQGNGPYDSEPHTFTFDVTPVNDAPTVAISPGGTIWDQGTFNTSMGGTNITTQRVLADFSLAEDRVLGSLTVVLNELSNVTEGVLGGFNGTLSWGIYSVVDGQPGTLLLSGMDTSPLLVDTGVNLDNNTDVFRATINLGNVTLAAGTYMIGVREGAWLSSSDSSIITWVATPADLGASTYFRMGNGGDILGSVPGGMAFSLQRSFAATEQVPLSLKGSITVADIDAGAGSMTVTLSADQGVLIVTAGASGAIVAGSGTGTVTLTGTLTQIDALLRTDATSTVHFSVPAGTSPGSATLTVTADDHGQSGTGGALTGSASHAIEILGTDHVPVAVDDLFELAEDVPVTFAAADLLGNDGGAGLSIARINNTTGGTAVLNGDGTITFTPTANFNGTAGFDYMISNGLLTDFAHVTITVAAVNDAPTVSISPIGTVWNQLTPSLEDAFAISHSEMLADFSLTGAQALDRFTVTLVENSNSVNGVFDGFSGTLSWGIYSVVNGAPGTLLFSGADASPLLVDTGVNWAGGMDIFRATINLGDLVLGPGDYMISLHEGAFGSSYDGSTIYWVTAATDLGANTFFDLDRTGGGDVTVDSYAGGLAFSLTGTSLATEQVPLSLKGTITVADIDAGTGNMTVTLGTDYGVLAVAAGTSGATIVSGNGTGSVVVSGTLAQLNALLRTDATSTVHFTANTGTPPASATLTVTVDDNGNSGADGSQSASATRVIQIVAIDYAPEGADKVITIDEDTGHSFTAADFGFSDADGHAFAAVRIATVPAAGTLTLNGIAVTAGQSVAVADLPLLVFTPAANANGSGYSSFTFQVRDDSPDTNTDPTPNTITFDVTPVNDAPVITNLQGDVATQTEGVGGTPFVDVGRNAVLTDVDSADFAGGRLTVSVANHNGVDQVGVFADGTISVDGARNVSVGGVIIGVASGGQYATPRTGTLTIDFNASATPALVQSLIRNLFVRDGRIEPAGGTRDITLTLSDGDGGSSTYTSSLVVTAINDEPGGADKTITINEDAPRSFAAADFGFVDNFNDGDGGISEGQALEAVIITTLPAAGSLTLDGVAVTAGQRVAAADIGNLVFTPAANANGNAYASFTFQVVDNGGTANGGQDTDQSPNTITFNVTPVNDAPVVTITTPTLFAPPGDEFLVNTATYDIQRDPAITSLASGGFVVTWEDFSRESGDWSYSGITAQIFDATGAKVGGEFLVNTATWESQEFPTITSLASGGFVVSWVDNSGQGGDASFSSIKAQIFDAAGAKVGSEFLVNTVTLNSQDKPTITSLASGGFVVSWMDFSGQGGDASSFGIKAQIFDAAGAKVGSEFLVNTATYNRQLSPTITSLASGGFVVSWEDDSGQGGDASVSSIKAQIFDAAGAKVGSEFLVNTVTTGAQNSPAITSLASGGFVVTWMGHSSLGGPGDGEIKAQVFDATGAKVGGEFMVNTATWGTQRLPVITSLASGAIVISWRDMSGEGGDDSWGSIKARIFSPLPDDFQATEQVPLSLKGAVTVADVDAGAGTLSATLSVDFGVLNVSAGTSGATIVSGNGTGSVVVSGTLAQLNALLRTDATSTISFTANTDAPPASTTLTVSVNDGGNTGSGGAQTGVASVQIGIIAVNDAPTATGYDDVTFTEGDLFVQLDTGFDLVLTDVDSPNFDGGTFTVSVSANKVASEDVITFLTGGTSFLSISGGVISYHGIAFATLSASGVGLDRVVTFNENATLQAVQTLMRNVAYSNSNLGNPSTEPRTISYTLTDGDGGTLNLTSTVTVVGVNDAPSTSVPGDTQNGLEDSDLIFSTANGNAISVADPDQLPVTVTIAVSNGVLTLSGLSGLTFSVGDGSGDRTMTFSGTPAAINAALEGLRYRGDLNYHGADTLSISINDGSLSSAASVAIALAPDNVINGDGGDNSLQGTPQGDYFDLSQGGDDNVSGEAGDDGFYFGGAYDHNDVVDGGAGNRDQVGLQGDYSAGVTLGSLIGVEMVVLLAGNDARFGGATGTDLAYNIVADANTIVSGNRLTIQANTLRAGESLTFDGSASSIDFLIYGGLGTDVLTGGSGNDGFFFGQGRFGANDIVDGGAGSMDQLGFQGDFTGGNAISFGAAQLSGIEYIVLLSAGDDRFGAFGGVVDYDLTMHDGNVASGGTMIVSATTLRIGETLAFDGSAEADGAFRIFSGAGDDLLIGGQGDDEIWGGAGNDVIRGGLGADTLRGGAGDDLFLYGAVAESQGAPDRIMDFALGDQISLTDVYQSVYGMAGSFEFVGDGEITAANQLRVVQTGNQAIVYLHLGSPTVPAMVINVTVADGHTLTAADFLGVTVPGIGMTPDGKEATAFVLDLADPAGLRVELDGDSAAATLAHGWSGGDGFGLVQSDPAALPDLVYIGMDYDLALAGSSGDLLL